MPKEKKNNKNRVQSFFLLIFVPAVFTLTLLTIVLSFMGVNVLQKAEAAAGHLPVISQWVSASEEESVSSSKEQLERTIEKNNSEIQQLEAENKDKDATIEELNQSIEELEMQLEKSSEDEETEEDDPDQTSETARAFQEMDEKEAAPIIENMNENLAVSLLEKVKSDQRGAILGMMDPEKAAELTSLMTSTN
ncbi:MotE family protein [Halobacillus sp. Marseille-P3879]|uniref:MotE family protein n=1 Tax=Halobacillus sp. Marseille-P3879 TaxID=2045014 RepID=UPI000C7989F5|nr:hypothetical protein [Halobacillus sp. Marseille-P3879]